MSSLNARRSENREVVSDRAGRAGTVFAHLLDLLDSDVVVKEVLGGVLENVTGLAVPPRDAPVAKSNWAVCQSELYLRGWLMVTLHLDPRCVGHPQSRPRLFMLVFSRLLLQKYGVLMMRRGRLRRANLLLPWI